MQTSIYFTPFNPNYVQNDAHVPLFARAGKAPAFYDQKCLPDDQLLEQRMRLNALLGAGGSGMVYSCVINGYDYVVKIPNALLKSGDVLILHDGRIQLRSENARVCSARERANALRDAYREFAIAEMVMDTPVLRNAYRDREYPGERIKRLSAKEYQDHLWQYGRMQAHPGFTHLLRMMHLCRSVPCLIMEHCNGSSQDMYQTGELFSFKELFASHVLMGMEFLRDVAGLANTDLKYDNVMYRRDRQTSAYTFVIVDYGGCGRIDRPWSDNLVGTHTFSPPRSQHEVRGTVLPLWCPDNIDPLSVSVYAYAAMLLYLYCPACKPYQSDSCAIELTINAPPFASQDPVLDQVLNILRASPQSVLGQLPALRALFVGTIATEEPHFAPNNLEEPPRLRDPTFFYPLVPR